MSDGERSAVQSMKPTEALAVPDCIFAQPEFRQLISPHHAVLPTGKRRELTLYIASL